MSTDDRSRFHVNLDSKSFSVLRNTSGKTDKTFEPVLQCMNSATEQPKPAHSYGNVTSGTWIANTEQNHKKKRNSLIKYKETFSIDTGFTFGSPSPRSREASRHTHEM
jgi:hypothetical protein